MASPTGPHPDGLPAGISTVHFVGIGGIGMSALAQLLLSRGKRVTGSDAKASEMLERLRTLGAVVAVGHRAEGVRGADLVVTSSAVGVGNPEIDEAERLRIPVVKRAVLLGWLFNESYGLAVAGTHGKTTTTAMLAFVLSRAGLDPTALIGGEPLDFEAHGLLGNGPYLVAEADEYDRSFLQMWPKVTIVTSVEADHLDIYADMGEIERTFREFASRVPAAGLLVTCAEDPRLEGMDLDVPRERYGEPAGADWRLVTAVPDGISGTRFRFRTPEGDEQECRLSLPGRHYALDALAAIAAARHVGVEPALAAEVLAGFHGTRRRYERIGEAGGVIVVDDYAHHPTAVAGTLGAARERHSGRIWCVFQPHTTNRTEKLLEQFARAFGDADRVLLLPVYQPVGREDEAGAAGSRNLLGRMTHPDARCVEGLDEAVDLLEGEVTPGDLVITMGAGDVNRVGPLLLRRLASNSGAES